MIKELRKILCDNENKEITKLRQMLRNMNVELQELKTEREVLEEKVKEEENKYFQKSSISKAFSKSKFYAKLKILEEKIKKIDIKISKIRFSDKEQIGREEIMARIMEREDNIADMESAHCLQSLGYDLESAITLLKEKNEPLILTGEDKNILEINQTPLRFENLFLVGRLESAPKNKMLLNDEKNIQNIEFIVNGDETEISENSKPYLVIMPLEDVPKKLIESVENGKVIINGNIELSKRTILLCPKGEGKQIENDNLGNSKIYQFKEDKASEPIEKDDVYDEVIIGTDNREGIDITKKTKDQLEFKILEYEGYIDGYAEALITNLGGRFEKRGEKGWLNQKDYVRYEKIITREGILGNKNIESKEKKGDNTEIINVDIPNIEISDKKETTQTTNTEGMEKTFKSTQDLGKETADVQEETEYKEKIAKEEREEMNENIAAIFWNGERGE